MKNIVVSRKLPCIRQVTDLFLLHLSDSYIQILRWRWSFIDWDGNEGMLMIENYKHPMKNLFRLPSQTKFII